jgi:hypothetical protein
MKNKQNNETVDFSPVPWKYVGAIIYTDIDSSDRAPVSWHIRFGCQRAPRGLYPVATASRFHEAGSEQTVEIADGGEYPVPYWMWHLVAAWQKYGMVATRDGVAWAYHLFGTRSHAASSPEVVVYNQLHSEARAVANGDYNGEVATHPPYRVHAVTPTK